MPSRSATPNHWHALTTIWACQAGKDVYCEKPACYNVHEGERMIEAARKYQPHGADRLAEPQRAAQDQGHAAAQRGRHRQGLHGQGTVLQAPQVDWRTPDEPVPPGVNWDMFLGPAPMRPFNELRFKYNWHWFWDTGNGDIGNQGVHEMDIARWGLGSDVAQERGFHRRQVHLHDDQETPNTQIATFDYGDKQNCVRGARTPHRRRRRHRQGGTGITSATCSIGSDGWMWHRWQRLQGLQGREGHENW